MTMYGKKAKLCFMDTDGFIVHVKSKDVYADLTGDVNKRFNTSNYEVKRPLPIEKNRKDQADKGELDGGMMKVFAAMRPKMYSYLKNKSLVDKKAKSTKKCAIKQKIKFEDYKECLEKNKVN